MWFVDSRNTSEEHLQVIVVEYDITSHKEEATTYSVHSITAAPFGCVWDDIALAAVNNTYYCTAILPAEYNRMRMRSFSSFLTFSYSGYSLLSLTRTKTCLSNCWRWTLLLDLLQRVPQIIIPVLAWTTFSRYARRARSVLEYR